MKCSDCKKTLEVGDRYIQFTASEWAERNGMKPLAGMDDLIAGLMGSDTGDKIIYCEDCTVQTDDGYLFDTVYGDEEE